jgi:hypothetical protein
VAPEDARSYYTGATLFWTASTSTTSATVTLTATIKDISAVTGDPAYDAYAGDISKARVTFINRDNTTPDTPIGGTCSNLQPSLVNASDTTVGTVTCQVSLSAGSSSASQYTIGIQVTGYYTDDSGNENTVIDVAQPLATNFITGGGFLLNPSNTAGTYAGAPGLKTNFGFNVKYNKGGTNLQGNVNIIVRKGGRVYQFKANSLASLGVQYYNDSTRTFGATPGGTCTTTATATCPIKSTFQAKANLNDVTGATAISIAGNLTLTMAMTDYGEPGSSDTLAITVYNGNSLWLSTQWNGTQTVEKSLDGGNLVAH